MTPRISQHLRVLEALEHLETIRNWFHQAPIDELEAVEKALSRNAPITETSEAIALLVTVASELHVPEKG